MAKDVKKIHPRHRLFLAEYIRNGLNGTEAYKTVYKVENSSTANANSWRLLRNPIIQEELTRLLGEEMRGFGTKEYLSKRLHALSSDSKRDADKIRALELIAKIEGLLSDKGDTNINLHQKIDTKDIREKLRSRKDSVTNTLE